MVNLILTKFPEGGQSTKEIVSLATNPNFVVPSFTTVNGHNYEVRDVNTDGGVTTYNLSDSGVEQ